MIVAEVFGDNAVLTALFKVRGELANAEPPRLAASMIDVVDDAIVLEIRQARRKELQVSDSRDSRG